MAKIFAPNKQYTGLSAGVAFANGEAETDNPHLIEWFRVHGYQVGDTASEVVPENETPETVTPEGEVVPEGASEELAGPESKEAAKKGKG